MSGGLNNRQKCKINHAIINSWHHNQKGPECIGSYTLQKRILTTAAP